MNTRSDPEPNDSAAGERTLFDEVEPNTGRDGRADESRSLWPPQDHFPLNEADRAVGQVVGQSYAASSTFTIVTAFTSLEHLLSFFSRHEIGERTVDVVLGNEPSVETENLYADTRPIERQARDYWLRQGVSVLTGGGAVRLMEAMDAGQVRFFALESLHAKIYVGDDGAVLGSSNFSAGGLYHQREANSRFEGGSDRYEELSQIAEQYRKDARECTAEIGTLLEQLLQPVHWKEALARAAAEVLEGEWVERYPEAFRLLQEQNLWPHQEQAIAQGLWILDTRGSVLVADATGSGKTRVGTHLLYGLLNRLWSQGQAHRTDATVVCPPNVTDNWAMEIEKSPASSVDAISHGKLSQGKDIHRVQRQVRRSNVLFLDEAHNYLSRDSKRSKAVTSSAADYAALLTATPINRGTSDLLRMIELMGLDNLTDGEFDTYKRLRTQTNFTSEDEQELRSIVRQCTIRRTKQDLNRLVERRPSGYTTDEGTVHRFPEHVCKTYETGETEPDKQLAEEINDLAGKLRGLLWLRTFYAPPWVQGDRTEEVAFLERKVKGAKGLAGHTIRSALQSSRVALLEVVYGTRVACERIDLETGLKDRSGDYLHAVDALRSDPPAENSNLDTDLPRWLTSGLDETIDREKRLLCQIGEKAAQLSDARARARAQKIRDIAKKEEVLLAFGARPLTLHDLQAELERNPLEQEVVVADGSLSAAQRKEVTRTLGLGGAEQAVGEDDEDAGGLVALCSDAMSEGLNLQRAASVVLLDTPSVIRIAEQRVGRIDRMDSPHEQIEVWWPDDSPAFQSDKRDLLIERYNVNERLMGNNIKLPEPLGGGDRLFDEDAVGRASADDLIAQYQEHQEEGPDERLDDAFRPVRDLVGLGEGGVETAPSLVDREVYEHIAGTSTAVWSRITIMEADHPWGFFCLRGREGRAPRWVLLHKGHEEGTTGLGVGATAWRVRTRLGPIAEQLRQFLSGATPTEHPADPSLWQHIEDDLEDMLDRVRKHERELLSNKARHGLSLLDNLLYRYELEAQSGSEREQICSFLRRILSSGRGPWADLHDLADEWLGIVQPRYVEWKRDARGNTPIRLKDMEEPLIKDPIETDALRRIAQSTEREEPVGRRLAAAIVALSL